MVQLRHDYEDFQALNTEVLVIVPNGPRMIARYVSKNDMPYPILSDRGSKVADQYGIDTRQAILLTTLKPTVFLVDTNEVIRHVGYGSSYIKQPDNKELLAMIV